jgi:tetratricopeptide (TPR) repeat protein
LIKSLPYAALAFAIVLSGCARDQATASAKSKPAATNAPPTDPKALMEQELKKLEEADDIAKAETDEMINRNAEFAAKGAGLSEAEMSRRIRQRLEPVRKGYEDFIQRHPEYAPARIAYASFLNDIGDEDGEFAQLEKARELDPTDPAVWNNLANYYGHNSPVTNAFAYYEKAISLDGNEPIYYHNFGTTVYLFRKDAREYYGIEEQQVFDKALNLYSNAMRLDPTNYALATDVAMTYYGIKPLRADDALHAWTNALQLAPEQSERERVYLHLARIEMAAGRYAASHDHLNAVTNQIHDVVKQRLARNLNQRETETNAPSPPQGNLTPADQQLIQRVLKGE